MTLLDCAKRPDFVLVKCPGLAAIHQEGRKALIVYCNIGRGHASQTPSCADGHKNTMLLGCEKQVALHRAVTGFGAELRRQSGTLRRKTTERFMLPSITSMALDPEAPIL